MRRVLLLLSLLGIGIPIAGQSSTRFERSTIDFDYPAGWRPSESSGPEARSIVLVPERAASPQIYIGVQKIADNVSARNAHEQKVRSYLAEHAAWRRVGDTQIDDRPGGRGLTSTLEQGVTSDRQYVTTFRGGGLLVLTAMPGSSGVVAVRGTILNSLSFGLPGRLRLNRAPASAASALIGKWREGASALTFAKDDAVTYELFKTRQQTQQLLHPRRGRFRAAGGLIHTSWTGNDIWPAEEDVCVFAVADTTLNLLCRNDGQQLTFSR